MAFELPALPYSFDALEPHIDARTMEIHHGKHHAAYVSKANAALEGTKFASMSVEDVLRNIEEVPQDIRQGVINNAGGHANHTLFWEIMGPGGGGEPSGELADAINSKFGSFDTFKDQFAAAATGRFGSGWAWLVVDGGGQLHVYNTLNQDSPLMEGHVPVLGLDVWEHAYYLKYQNLRPDYVGAWWNVVKWSRVGELFAAAKR